MDNHEMYKKSRNEVTKVIGDAKFKSYDDLYNKLRKRGGKDIFEFARMRERKEK